MAAAIAESLPSIRNSVRYPFAAEMLPQAEQVLGRSPPGARRFGPGSTTSPAGCGRSRSTPATAGEPAAR
jgi:hypothetical protein